MEDLMAKTTQCIWITLFALVLTGCDSTGDAPENDDSSDSTTIVDTNSEDDVSENPDTQESDAEDTADDVGSQDSTETDRAEDSEADTEPDVVEDANLPDRGDGRPPITCETISDDLDTFIEARMEETDIPGLAAGIVGPQGLVWSRGYGHANIEEDRAVTPDTVFAIMSISKVFTATGVMQLVAAGDLDLDEDINTYLSAFDVVHPDFPDTAITMRQLLSHTSGIGRDDYGVLQLNIKTSDEEVEPLGEMLQSILTPEGERFDAAAPSYEDTAPGDTFRYSSIAISLAGFVAESVSGTSFDELTAGNIFDVLGMEDTSWRLGPYADRLDEVAVMYDFDELDEEFIPVDHFTFADYPAGSIRSTVRDLSLYLAAMINEGVFEGDEVLSQVAYREMMEVPYPDANSAQALGWNYRFDERTLAGHGGDDSGASTDMYFDVDRGIGVILLMNVTRRPNTDEILARIFEASEVCE